MKHVIRTGHIYAPNHKAVSKVKYKRNVLFI